MNSPDPSEVCLGAAGDAVSDVFEQMRRAFARDVDWLGLKSEQDAVDLVKQVRAERREEAGDTDHD